MTTGKNNYCYQGASAFAKAAVDETAPGLKNAARLRGVKKGLFLQVV